MTATRVASTRASWRSVGWWLALAAIIALAGLGVALSSPSPGRALDPTSAAPAGSHALSVLLADRGTTSTPISSVAAAVNAAPTSTVLITSPDDFSTDQLHRLVASGHRLVAIEPGPRSLAALDPARSSGFADAGPVEPGCDWAGAHATGVVDYPNGVSTYSGPGGCYAGTVVVTPKLVIIGTPDALMNRHLGNGHLAALAINALSDDGTVSDVAWLLPGDDAAGPGAPTVWSIFPPWVGRAVWTLLVLGLLLAIWQGRRLGPVVREPLPVIVPAAEVVEGHGRLYRRAQAREQAAAALRSGTVSRLARRGRLPRSASAAEVAAMVPGGAALFDGQVPADDQALVQLARDLDDLEQRSRNGADQQ